MKFCVDVKCKEVNFYDFVYTIIQNDKFGDITFNKECFLILVFKCKIRTETNFFKLKQINAYRKGIFKQHGVCKCIKLFLYQPQIYSLTYKYKNNY